MKTDPLEWLPGHLHERSRIFGSLELPENPQPNGFVVYWMRSAVRSDENPALDVARLLAEKLQLPLLVYHSISSHYEFASDRHHTFMLQGARDVQQQFESLGISYAFHLATAQDREPHLIDIAGRTTVLVTEDMPVDPPRKFLNSLVAKTSVPVVCVDTACVVPMQLVGQSYTRAFKFRDKTKRLRKDRLQLEWPTVDVADRAFETNKLPFTPLDLGEQSIAELVARCEIDHSVGPVVDTVGGSNQGYARWQRFKKNSLGKYAKRRNNALLPDAVSRMSAYLHYGMVSPMRLAREAAEHSTAGSEKYLDELLIWRELAYTFCFYRDDHDQISAIPDWALETLDRHTADARPEVYSWEELARAATSDSFWNVAQQSLLMHGELHNNVRMTWGKAILNWCETPQRALNVMIDLNHRYALDGRDPSSYGGLLWCLGQFDRPFEPPSPIFGTVRPRSTKEHAKRLDTNKYHQSVSAVRFEPTPTVGVIGAGMSGLFAARTLADHGVNVSVFEKSRGCGGRMSTRWTDAFGFFDHGAQYFTASNRDFQRYVQSWLSDEVVAQWPDPTLDSSQKIAVLKDGSVTFKSDSQARYVGTPGMNAIGQHLGRDLNIRLNTQVQTIRSAAVGHELLDADGKSLGTFDQLIVAVPVPQAARLLEQFPVFGPRLDQVQMDPCWATMASFSAPLTDQWAGAFVHDSPISWAARNRTKPQRDRQFENLVLHASPEWTKQHLELEKEEIWTLMLDAFWHASGIQPRDPEYVTSHRWRYAIPVSPTTERCVWDRESGITACGDWAGGPRVEGAFLSGMAAAGRVLGTLKPMQTAVTEQQKLF